LNGKDGDEKAIYIAILDKMLIDATAVELDRSAVDLLNAASAY
jgi:hypothetical protein